MSKLVSILTAISFLAISPSAFAQKQSCQDFCAKQCEMSSYGKNMCLPTCMSKCNQKRSEKAK
jgi:hypothetical protein